MNEPLTSTREIRIEFGDCDPAGIVFYPNYFRMFDACTAGLLENALGQTKVEWTKRFGILGIPMVDTGARFLKPCRYGDRVTVATHAERIGRSSFRIVHSLFNGTVLSVEGWEARVWVSGRPSDPASIRPAKIPAEVRTALGHAAEPD